MLERRRKCTTHWALQAINAVISFDLLSLFNVARPPPLDYAVLKGRGGLWGTVRAPRHVSRSQGTRLSQWAPRRHIETSCFVFCHWKGARGLLSPARHYDNPSRRHRRAISDII